MREKKNEKNWKEDKKKYPHMLNLSHRKQRNKLNLSRETSSSSETPSPFQPYELEKKNVLRRTKSAEGDKRYKMADSMGM